MYTFPVNGNIKARNKSTSYKFKNLHIIPRTLFFQCMCAKIGERIRITYENQVHHTECVFNAAGAKHAGHVRHAFRSHGVQPSPQLKRLRRMQPRANPITSAEGSDMRGAAIRAYLGASWFPDSSFLEEKATLTGAKVFVMFVIYCWLFLIVVARIGSQFGAVSLSTSFSHDYAKTHVRTYGKRKTPPAYKSIKQRRKWKCNREGKGERKDEGRYKKTKRGGYQCEWIRRLLLLHRK